MTRREIKFALQVEQLLNKISEPEFREIIVEALTLLGHLKRLLKDEPKIPTDAAFNVERIVYKANELFVEHNVILIILVIVALFNQSRQKI